MIISTTFYRQSDKNQKPHEKCAFDIASQNVQDLLVKIAVLVEKGVKTVRTIEPFTNTIFVTTKNGEEKFTNQTIETEGIKVISKKSPTANTASKTMAR